MPEMNFSIRWPDGRTDECYSPSLIIEEYLAVDTDYTVDDFVTRVRTALNIASERVRARYGFACSSALDQLRAIEDTATGFDGASRVRVVGFTRHAARDARAAAKAPEHHAVIVVGAGQAGLSVSYFLKQRGVDHVVLEAERVGHAWRDKRWDSFCLVTPNWQCRLPGHPYVGDDPYGFMQKDEIVEYVASYARKYALPVREGVRVVKAHRAGTTWVLATSQGQLTADELVVATGSYHEPRVPECARRLPPGVRSLHSSEYKRPSDLPDGAVLVVGTGQSGCQIAEDLHFAGRRVHLAVGNAPRCARRYRGKDVVEWLHSMGYYDIPIDQHPNREQVRDKTNHYVTGRDGGRDIDLRQLALDGLQLYGPLADIADGRARFTPELNRNLDAADDVYRSINRTIDAYIAKAGIEAPLEAPYEAPWRPEHEPESLDLTAAGVTSVIWSTGFRANFGWLAEPVFDERGHPRHERGVAAVDGLYFIGLPWLFTWGSGRFSGVARDAAHLAEIIVPRVTVTAQSRA